MAAAVLMNSMNIQTPGSLRAEMHRKEFRMMNLLQLFSLIPIAVVIVAMVKFQKSTRVSMILGCIAAWVVAWIQGTDLVLAQTGSLLLATVTENWSLFLSLLVFGMLVYTMTRSQAAAGLEHVVVCLVRSRFLFVVLLLLSCVLFSVDDYLACIFVCMSLTACGKGFGLASARIAVLVNMVVAGICALVPYSTWAPVIHGALVDGGAVSAGWRSFAFFPVVNILLVLGYGIFSGFHRRHAARQAVESTCSAACASESIIGENHHTVAHSIERSSYTPAQSLNPSGCRKSLTHADRLSVAAILLSAGALVGTFCICNLAGVSNGLLVAACVSLLVTVVSYTAFGFIRPAELRPACREGIQTMGDLDLTLIAIWTFTGLMNQVLHVDSLIVTLLYMFQVPVWILPALYFIVSALFGYFTGSSFASFRLMIPLAAAAAVLLEGDAAALLIGAAVSGSLFASVSMTSDTLVLSVKGTGCAFKEAFALQTRYAICTFVICTMAYLVAGACMASLGSTYSVVISFLIIVAAAAGVSFLFMMRGQPAYSNHTADETETTPDNMTAEPLAPEETVAFTESTTSEEV